MDSGRTSKMTPSRKWPIGVLKRVQDHFSTTLLQCVSNCLVQPLFAWDSCGKTLATEASEATKSGSYRVLTFSGYDADYFIGRLVWQKLDIQRKYHTAVMYTNQ